MTRRLKTKLRGDELFRQLIDEFFAADDLFKIARDERDRLRKQLVRMIRYGHRKHGVHFGQAFAIYAHTVRRKVFVQDKARLLLGPERYKQAFGPQQFMQIDALEHEDATKQQAKEQSDGTTPDGDRRGGENPAE